MLTRIEVNDLLIENAENTIDAEVNPPEPGTYTMPDGTVVTIYNPDCYLTWANGQIIRADDRKYVEDTGDSNGNCKR